MASGLLKILRGALIRPLKIEALKIYIKAVGIARELSLWVLKAAAALILGAIAFVMVHVGVLILLPVSLETKGLIILVLGAVYGVIAYSLLMDMSSEKAWLDMSKATEMLDDLLKKEDEE
ncbi:MAG TPA: hypothetical protein DET40_07640 [Lentisphaeria bacterium]|nr:MAG: hypothetical protein A2X45_06655 [Lentisphaerae bacterium GWF2_50_93]HCE43405.1 hypothetical protein [Lentisphaeria bacterium]